MRLDILGASGWAGPAFATPAGIGNEDVVVKTGFALSTPSPCLGCNGLVVQSSAACTWDTFSGKIANLSGIEGMAAGYRQVQQDHHLHSFAKEFVQ